MEIREHCGHLEGFSQRKHAQQQEPVAFPVKNICEILKWNGRQKIGNHPAPRIKAKNGFEVFNDLHAVFLRAGNIQKEVREHDTNHHPVEQIMDDLSCAHSIRKRHTEDKICWD